MHTPDTGCNLYDIKISYYVKFHIIPTGKGVLSEHEHFPSGASGQSSLEYKCAYVCIYIRKSSLDYDLIKIFIQICCILAITHGNCNHSVPVLGGGGGGITIYH